MNPFTEHPASVGESYAEHLKTASGFGFTMMASGFACLVHGLVPSLFERTGSNAILHLHERMVANRRKRKSSPSAIDFVI